MNAPSPRRSHGVALNPAARAERLARRPAIEYPPDLPVSEKREEIARAIRANQVVIVCGETGSGKTTQLPKILLEMGRGIDGLIGHTQPRRIAARATAARIAQELKTELGSAVGFKIRFTDQQPGTAWNKAAANEYGFYSNVNPDVDHPRWSQATERRIGEEGGLFAKRRKTQLFNGYEPQVGQLYAGMDLKKSY